MNDPQFPLYLFIFYYFFLQMGWSLHCHFVYEMLYFHNSREVSSFPFFLTFSNDWALHCILWIGRIGLRQASIGKIYIGWIFDPIIFLSIQGFLDLLIHRFILVSPCYLSFQIKSCIEGIFDHCVFYVIKASFINLYFFILYDNIFYRWKHVCLNRIYIRTSV